MPFFDNFTKKVGDAAKTVAKKSGELVEITKLNGAISACEDKIKKCYSEMGMYVYSKYDSGEEVGNDLSAYCRQIAEQNREIEKLERKILELKNVKLCVNCKQEIGTEVIFCPKCGTKQPGPQQEKSETHAEASKIEKLCPACGAKIEEDTSFCTSCGHKL